MTLRIDKNLESHCETVRVERSVSSYTLESLEMGYYSYLWDVRNAGLH